MTLRLGTSAQPLRPAARWVNGPPKPEELKGYALLMHFWSLSCKPCVAQLPRVEEWTRKYGDRLRVVSVHTPLEVDDMDHEKVLATARSYAMSHPLALDGDDGALADLYQVGRTPAYYLFDAEKKLRAFLAGDDAATQVESALERLLGEAGREAQH